MRVLLTLLAVLLLPALGFADTFIIPDDFPTIQDAIDSAQNGDLVLVKPGTYNEQINFKGRAITIRSDVDCDASTHDIAPDKTIIDGNVVGVSDSVVKFTAAETAAFKAANLAQAPKVVTLHPVAQTIKPSHRQQWEEFRNETLGMIEAAKRERHFHLLPQLMQRLQNANTILATIA